jgi:predicted nucleic acid-binding protein
LAETAGLNVIGTLGLLLQAKLAGVLASIRPELDKLLETSFFLSQQLYDELLHIADEYDTQ